MGIFKQMQKAIKDMQKYEEQLFLKYQEKKEKIEHLEERLKSHEEMAKRRMDKLEEEEERRRRRMLNAAAAAAGQPKEQGDDLLLLDSQNRMTKLEIRVQTLESDNRRQREAMPSASLGTSLSPTTTQTITRDVQELKRNVDQIKVV
jgi:chromosome segregation ATPase